MRMANIIQLGVKELRSLVADPVMLLLIVYVFTLDIYVAATVMPETLHNAPIGIVDEDQSPLSRHLADAFYPPKFQSPAIVSINEADLGLDQGTYTFILDIPPDFQRDLLAGRRPPVQLNVDATRMTQAFTGSGYIEAMVNQEAGRFLRRDAPGEVAPVELAMRVAFNPSLTQSWFGAVLEIINNVTILSIILTGAALIRERERGTIEHLLVMPVEPFEIMVAKIWSMGLVVLLACGVSVIGVVQGALQIPIEGSVLLFLFGASINIFATTTLGILLGTVTRSMQQFGLLMILILIPLMVLSGGMTPQESMPVVVQWVMTVAPTTHFVNLAQAILYRGADLAIVWPELLDLVGIGVTMFCLTLWYFRRAMRKMA